MKRLSIWMTDLLFLVVQLVIIFGNFSSVLLGHRMMNSDLINITLPLRHAAYKAVSSGYLPFWNPYLSGGIAQWSDNNIFYPVPYILGWLHGEYNLQCIHLEVVLHLWIAAAGVYFWLRALSMDRWVAAFGGLTIALSGFSLIHAQHLGWIVGLAWSPWIFGLLHRWSHGKSWWPYLTIVAMLTLTGSYPGYTLILGYASLIYVGYVLIERRQESIKKRALPLALWSVAMLAWSLPVLVGIYYGTTEITRNAYLPIDTSQWGVLFGSLAPYGLITFVNPALILEVGQVDWIEPRHVGNGLFIGLWIFPLLIPMLLRKQTRPYLLLGLLCFLIAMTDISPLRGWLAYLPGLSSFRLPTIFRGMGLLFLVVGGCQALQPFTNSSQDRRRYALWLLLWIVAILIAFGLYTLGGNTRFALNDTSRYWLFVDILLVGLLFYWKNSKTRWLTVLSIMLIWELSIATQVHLNQLLTTPTATAPINQQIHQFNTHPIAWDLKQPLASYQPNILQHSLPGMYWNIGTYIGHPDYKNYNPYESKNFRKLEEEGVIEKLYQQPILHLTGSGEILSHHVRPNMLDIRVSCTAADTLVVLQNGHPNWEVLVDNQQRSFLPQDMGRSVALEAGEHRILMHFNAGWFKPLWLAYCFLWLVALRLALKTKRQRLYSQIVLIIILIIGYFQHPKVAAQNDENLLDILPAHHAELVQRLRKETKDTVTWTHAGGCVPSSHYLAQALYPDHKVPLGGNTHELQRHSPPNWKEMYPDTTSIYGEEYLAPIPLSIEPASTDQQIILYLACDSISAPQSIQVVLSATQATQSVAWEAYPIRLHPSQQNYTTIIDLPSTEADQIVIYIWNNERQFFRILKSQYLITTGALDN